MAHCPNKCGCSFCSNCESKTTDGIETGRICLVDGKSIEHWGTDKCPETKTIKFK